MTGVGENVGVLRESAANVQEAIDENGVLRLNFKQPYNKRYSPANIQYPTAYVDVRLEADYEDPKAPLCDLTYWAVEFLYLVENA